ncbi:MAG: undecaprenyl/decaprenyl-phosphate alpha-N-acetylglucosaminyl 1-phosphate transferase [Thermales bacterium]|nr:undecaprenyl/decaprenyl-phosphate alpha-N-acetylglucosaminyl 1-phosphate transferase [Thermales bacterium]
MILTIGGYIDDKYNLKPKFLTIHITIALLVAVFFGGLQIEALSFPFDKILPQNSFLAYLFSFLWLGLCTASTKFLDGLDGLVSTVGVIAFLTIASISFSPLVFQPFTIIISLIWAFALLGYLPYNFPDAKSYLGEGGSEVIGFVIGVLSILSGAKVATISMVIGWFIIDIIFVIFLRLSQRKNPLKGDRLHWHFRLIDMGLSKHQALTLTTAIILITAQLGLILPTGQKVFVLIVQIILILVAFLLSIIFKKKNPQKG